jgi:hypothetical protein
LQAGQRLFNHLPDGQIRCIWPERRHGHSPTAGQQQKGGHASHRRMRVAAVPAVPFGPQ